MLWRRKSTRGLEKRNAVSAPKMRLGELMVQQGLVTQAQLDEALERQRSSYRSLGEILVEMDAINRRDLTRMLELQYRLSQESQEG